MSAERQAARPEIIWHRHPTMSTRYTYPWEFLIEPTRREEFERHYGPNGTWVTLFRRSAGYRGTLLLRDRLNPLRFVTVDRWGSEAA